MFVGEKHQKKIFPLRLQESEPEKFIYDLSNEVQRRLKSAGVKGKQVTIKVYENFFII